MRLLAHNFFTISFFILFSFFFTSVSFAATTPFRSANIVSTDGSPSYTNFSNCSSTDGNTCDRASASSFANLYFRDFGDFGIPSGSSITNLRLRVTGKATAAIYAGVSEGISSSSFNICQSPSDIWTMGSLNSSSIATYSATTVISSGLTSCLSLSNISSNNFIWRVNYSSGQSWSSNIDNFELAFDYDPPVTPTPTPTPTLTPTPTPTPTSTPTPTPIPKTPLILIPGIGGSELKTNDLTIWSESDGHGGIFVNTYSAGEKVWVNSLEAVKLGEDDYFDVLKMENDGLTSKANLTLTGNLFEMYQEATDFFIANGYTLNTNFFIFPYDWRKDIALTASLLNQKIDEIKSQTGSTKVDIVAHSMGGLVARNYINDSSRALNVRKLFTLGTPHLGSADYLKNLRFGGCITIFEQLKKPICFGVSPSETKDVLQNTISGFELAPTQEYFNFYTNYDSKRLYPYKTEAGVLNYNQTKDLLTSLGHNTLLFNPSEAFHSLDNNLANTNGVDVVVIAGSGRNTLGQIIEEKTKKDIVNINGDGTVPLFSASLSDPERNKSLLGSAKVYYTNQEHGNLVTSGSALNLVKNILENNSQLPEGVSTQAYTLPKGWLFSVHSPVDINIYDSAGNHTGLTSNRDFETNIPGSSYNTLDDAKFIWLPNDGQYMIKFEATNNGSFDFKIRKYENDTISQEILYKDIPLTSSTKAEAKFDTSSSQSPIVYLDKDGNGTIDQEVNPSVNQTPTSTPIPTATPTPQPTSSGTTSITPTPVVSATSSPIENNILGTQTASQNTLAGKHKEKFPLINSLIILTGAIVLVYIRLKK